jgi:hypothetical protein
MSDKWHETTSSGTKEGQALALHAFQDRLVRDAFLLIEKSEKFLDGRLELTFGPIAHFP